MTAQYDSDFLKFSLQRKRDRDASKKWSRGPMVFSKQLSELNPRLRPRKKWGDEHKYYNSKRKHMERRKKNYKPHLNRDSPVALMDAITWARQEVNEAQVAPVRSLVIGVSESSWQNSVPPNRPLGLDHFVKEPRGKDIEKQIAKEYEVLGPNGEYITGRKARDMLRGRACVPLSDTFDNQEHFEFELI